MLILSGRRERERLPANMQLEVVGARSSFLPPNLETEPAAESHITWAPLIIIE
jgi:hypothetical protein